MSQMNFFDDPSLGAQPRGRRGSASSHATQEATAPIRLSDEQQLIVIAPLRQRIKIRAGAGAGKTTTLEHKARHHAISEGKIGLYLAYNKSAQLEAQKRFGRTAICKTTHGIAFSTYGRKYVHKLREMRPKELVDQGVTPDYAEARLILDAIGQYCISADMEFPARISLGAMANRISAPRAAQLRELALNLWNAMCNPDSPVPMTHDGYLKLFQLSKPRLPGDYLMVDEFQDTNPVVLDIVMNQQQPTIVVGDPYQSIYAFRGAVNAMQDFKCQFNFAITESRRFGPLVADVANELLHGCYGEKMRIKGIGDPTELRTGAPSFSEPLSIIARTNAELFEHAVQALSSNQRTAYIGGVEGYKFRQIIDVQLVGEGRHAEVHDPFIRSFESKWAMADYAENVDDYDLQRRLKTCDAYGADIHELVANVTSAAVAETEKADRVMTTAHKSKGCTLDHVYLTEDFRSIVERSKEGEDWVWVKDLDPQEINLSYVAATRARKSLQLCSALLDYRKFYRAKGLSNSDAPPPLL